MKVGLLRVGLVRVRPQRVGPVGVRPVKDQFGIGRWVRSVGVG